MRAESISGQAASRLLAGLRRVSQAHRGTLLFAALVLLALGSWFSIRQLDLTLSDLHIAPLLVQFAIAPVSLLYAGVAMALLARSASVEIPLRQATRLAAWATLAEALPLPGGAMVRGGALMARGTGLARSSALILANAVLWISLAALGCAVSLIGHGFGSAMVLALCGAGGAVGACGWLVRTAGAGIAGLTVLHRLCGMGLIALRLYLAFLTIGVAVPLADTMPFALANIAGSAASIAPAGLGISETLAAAAAGTVNVAAGAAFLAVGLDRLVCLGASAVLALLSTREGTNGA